MPADCSVRCGFRPFDPGIILRKCQEGAKKIAFPACPVMIQEEERMGSGAYVESRTGKTQ